MLTPFIVTDTMRYTETVERRDIKRRGVGDGDREGEGRQRETESEQEG